MTQDNKNKIMFGRGTKSLEEFKSVTGYQNMVYFNTDEYEIYVGDNKYGFSKADQTLLKSAIDSISYDETTATFTVSFVDSTKDDVTFSIPTADTKTPGLMTTNQVTALGEAAAAVLRLEGYTDAEGVFHKGSVETAKEEAIAHANALVEALDLAEVKGEGQAIVSISQVDGKVAAVAGDVAASHVSVADTADNYTSSDVEGVLAEIAKKISDLDTSADGVDDKISAAIDELNFNEASTGGEFVTVTVVQEKGEIKSVTVAEDNIAKADELDALEALVGSADDAAAANGSVYARIAALVAEDGAIDGRLDVIEGEGEGSVKKALADAKTYVNEEIAKLDATVGSQTVAENKHVAVEVVETDGVLTALTVVESDIASAAALAAVKEDVDAFLAAAEVGEAAVDTLKEIQSYITSDLAAADQMVKDIAANKTAIETEVTNRENAIKGLNSEKTGEGTFVDVTVKQEAGVITSITVAEADIASAAALKSLSDTVGTSSDGKDAATVYGAIAAEADARVNAINGLSDKMGEPVNGTLAQDIVDAKKATSDLAEGAVADNTEAIALLNNTVETEGSVKHTAKGYADAAEEAAKAYADQALYWYEG